jgi:hypothetical protein
MTLDAEGAMARTEGRRPELGLALAGTLTSGMALYHFYLPYGFHWGDVLVRTPALHWGLFMLNASFSYLLLAGGVITIVMAFRPGLKGTVGRLVLLAMTGYWVFNACWQLLWPLPLPGGFAALRWAFLGFPVAVILLYASALVGRATASETAAAAHPEVRARTPGRYPGAR